MKLTFRKLRDDGEPVTDIKADGKSCGWISFGLYAGEPVWSIFLKVDEPEARFVRRLKQAFSTEPEAREWLKANWAGLLVKYRIHTRGDNA